MPHATIVTDSANAAQSANGRMRGNLVPPALIGRPSLQRQPSAPQQIEYRAVFVAERGGGRMRCVVEDRFRGGRSERRNRGVRQPHAGNQPGRQPGP